MYLLEKIERNKVLLPANKNRSLLHALLNSPEVFNAVSSQITECYTVYRDDFFNDPRKILIALANLVSKYDRKRRGDVRTPLKLVDEIVDKVDEQDPDYDDGVIDPACGNGSFLVVVQERVNNVPLVGVDINPRRCYIASALLNPYNDRKNVEIYCEDFLEDTVKRWSNRKFGLALGNPPFSKNNNPLYSKFYENGLEILHDKGLLTLVTPLQMLEAIRTGKIGHKKATRKKILYAEYDERLSNNYFPGIGSTFCYFIVNSEDNDSTDLWPIYVSDIERSILSKCFDFMANHYGASRSHCGDNIDIVEEKDADAIAVRTINSDFTLDSYPVKFKGSIHKFVGKPKVMYNILGTRTAGSGRSIVDRYPYTLVAGKESSMLTVITNNDIESENLQKLLNSKLCYFIATAMRNSRSSYDLFVKNLKKIDLSKSWTDADLYKNFNLTDEEAQYIENS